MSQTEPTAPALGSQAPRTTRATRDSTTAPAHIGHGSRVTASVCPSNRHDPVVRAAARRASTSACAVGSPSASRRLRPTPTTVPDGSTTTAPTGTSPDAVAPRACSSARSIHASNAGSTGHLTEASPKGVELVVEPAPLPDVGQHRAGVRRGLHDERDQVAGTEPEILQEPRVTGPGRRRVAVDRLGLQLDLGLLGDVLLRLLVLVLLVADAVLRRPDGLAKLGVLLEVDVGDGGEQVGELAAPGRLQVAHERPAVVVRPGVHPQQREPGVLTLQHGQDGTLVVAGGAHVVGELVQRLDVLDVDVQRTPP